MQELLCGQYPYAINVEDLAQDHFFPIWAHVARKMCERFSHMSFALVGLTWKEIIQQLESDESSRDFFGAISSPKKKDALNLGQHFFSKFGM